MKERGKGNTKGKGNETGKGMDKGKAKGHIKGSGRRLTGNVKARKKTRKTTRRAGEGKIMKGDDQERNGR